jgi:hypothetical protein
MYLYIYVTHPPAMAKLELNWHAKSGLIFTRKHNNQARGGRQK